MNLRYDGEDRLCTLPGVFSCCWPMATLLLQIIWLHVQYVTHPEGQEHPDWIQLRPLSSSGVFLTNNTVVYRSFSIIYWCHSIMKGLCGMIISLLRIESSAGSKCGAVFCVWRQISKVCTGTWVWPLKALIRVCEPGVNAQLVSRWSSTASLLSWPFTCWWTTRARRWAAAPTCLRSPFGTPPLESCPSGLKAELWKEATRYLPLTRCQVCAEV